MLLKQVKSWIAGVAVFLSLLVTTDGARADDSPPEVRENCPFSVNSAYCSSSEAAAEAWDEEELAKEAGYPLAKASLSKCMKFCTDHQGCKFVTFTRRTSCQLWEECSAEQPDGGKAVQTNDLTIDASCPTNCPMEGKKCVGRFLGSQTVSSYANCLHECEVSYHRGLDHNETRYASCIWISYDKNSKECRFLRDCDLFRNIQGWKSTYWYVRCLELEPL